MGKRFSEQSGRYTFSFRSGHCINQYQKVHIMKRLSRNTSQLRTTSKLAKASSTNVGHKTQQTTIQWHLHRDATSAFAAAVSTSNWSSASPH